MTLGDMITLLSDVLKMLNNPEIKGTTGTIVMVIALIMTILQGSKLPINPWSWVAKIVGRALNKEIFDQLKDIRCEVDGIRAEFKDEKESNDKDKAVAARRRILSAADEIRRGIPHSEEFFTEALADVDEYEAYCETHPDFENSKAENSIDLIRETHFTDTKENRFV